MKCIKYIVGAIFVCLGLQAFAGDKSIDWKSCEKEIATECAGKSDDHATHECLEKIKGSKISTECKKYNHSLESQFKSHHKSGHKH